MRVGAAVPWGSATPAPAPCSGQSPSGRLQQESRQPHGTRMLLHVPVMGVLLHVPVTGMLLHLPVTQMLLHIPVTGVLLHVPIAEVLLRVPMSGLLPHVPIVGMLLRSTGAGWPHPSGRSPQLTPAGAEEMLMGPWLVPWGLQQLLSLVACHDPSAALPVSMDHAVQLCLAGSLCPATANPNPALWAALPHPEATQNTVCLPTQPAGYFYSR